MAIKTKKSKVKQVKMTKAVIEALLKKIEVRKNWSMSHWETYHTCPRLYLFRRAWKLPEPPAPKNIFARGMQVHADMERYLKGGKAATLSTDLQPLAKLIDHAKSFKATAEERWAFTDKFKPTEYFATDAWLRVVVDTRWMEGRDLFVSDLKTGKPKEWHDTQAHLYAMSGMIIVPKARSATTHLWYADHPKSNAEVEYKRSSLPAMIKDWNKEARIMLTDQLCSPKPGRYCDWCSFAKSKKGPCSQG